MCLNEAKDFVLETRDWDFDHRHDGVLQTVASVSTGTMWVVNEAAGFATSTSDVFTPGDYVARLMVTSDGVQPQTAVRVLNYEATLGNMDAPWIGETDLTADYQFVFYEYKLPSYVKDVTAVRYQDQDVSLQAVGWDQGFRSAIPRPTDRIEDNPELVVVGAQVTPTYLTSAGEEEPGLGIAIYPCPLSRYRLEYSYKYRHPQLSESQGLENVSDAAVHDIVLNAFALMEASAGRDPSLAEANRLISEMRLNRHHDMNRADASRRKVLRSLDDRGAGDSRSLPANQRVFHEP